MIVGIFRRRMRLLMQAWECEASDFLLRRLEDEDAALRCAADER